MFFKHFASKNQLSGLSISGTLVENGLSEKFRLLKHFDEEHLLNKKSEFISKCRQENKLLVKSAEKG